MVVCLMNYKDIKYFSERCETHPDHQDGMISEQMLKHRLQEEIDELRCYIERRKWVGLPDEEIETLMDNYDVGDSDYARAIEQRLKEKNA